MMKRSKVRGDARRTRLPATWKSTHRDGIPMYHRLLAFALSCVAIWYCEGSHAIATCTQRCRQQSRHLLRRNEISRGTLATQNAWYIKKAAI